MDATIANWIAGSGAIAGTVLLQLGAQTLVQRSASAHTGRSGPGGRPRVLPVLALVFTLMLGHLAQTIVWAAVYLHLGHITAVADAVYFSLACYTTIGTNDVALSLQHRTLGAVEAATGVLMFGWSTALLTAELIHVRMRDAPR
jgi:voltage-gated potassium channel Kch